jgi:deoxyribonuclease IV
MSASGGAHRAVEAAHAIGFTTVQLSTKNNNRWDAPPLTDDQIQAFKSALKETKVRNPVAHNSYLINLASPDDTLWKRSIDAMSIELERAEALGIDDLVCHPGAHVGSGEEAGLSRVIKAIDLLHKRHRGFKAQIDLENTAGQGSCLGHMFKHLATILQGVKQPERLGICIDTCHVFAAGHDFATEDGYTRLIGALEENVGLDRIRVWHMNDSQKPCGSRVDRHAHIGRGCIGLEALGRVVRDPRFESIPKILETPKGIEDGVDLDTVNLEALRRLATPATQSSRKVRKTPSHAKRKQQRPD